jgi:hypothetical protein
MSEIPISRLPLGGLITVKEDLRLAWKVYGIRFKVYGKKWLTAYRVP